MFAIAGGILLAFAAIVALRILIEFLNGAYDSPRYAPTDPALSVAKELKLSRREVKRLRAFAAQWNNPSATWADAVVYSGLRTREQIVAALNAR